MQHTNKLFTSAFVTLLASLIDPEVLRAKIEEMVKKPEPKKVTTFAELIADQKFKDIILSCSVKIQTLFFNKKSTVRIGLESLAKQFKEVPKHILFSAFISSLSSRIPLIIKILDVSFNSVTIKVNHAI